MFPITPVLDPRGRPLDTITVQGLTLECIVGVYPHERLTPQPLKLDLALHLDTRAAAGQGLDASIDYARVHGELRFILEHSQFWLLETAAEALCRYLLCPPAVGAPHARPVAVDVRLTKPNAFAGRGCPALHVRRYADECTYEVEEKPFGQVDVVYATQTCGIYRLRVAPGREIPTHEHRVMDEAELVLSDGLWLQGEPVRAGMAHVWPRRFPHRYENPSAVEQTILCIDRPAFLPEDEVEVPPPAQGLRRGEGQSYYPPVDR